MSLSHSVGDHVHPWTALPDGPTEIDDPYDDCKESALVNTLVEGGVVLLIAAMINVAFWGVIRFGVVETPLITAQIA